MRKKIFIVMSAMLIFGLAIAVFSYGNTTNLTAKAMACCCCSGDSCPMKKKDADGKVVASTHEGCDCCGDSCPMMKKDADGKTMKMDADSCPMMKKDADGKTMKMDADSCPMMKDDASATTGTAVKHEMKMANGKSCDCPCCHKAKVTKDAPAI